MTRAEWTTVCRVDDIPVLGARRVRRTHGMDIAVFRNQQDQVFALLDRCPHKGGPLSQGIVFGTRVACPLHNWTIGLEDGCAQGADEGCTPRFSCTVEGGRVLLNSKELETHALEPVAPSAGPCASKSALSDATFDVQTPPGARKEEPLD